MATFPCWFCNALPGPVNTMPAMTLQLHSPWSSTHLEDRRFRWILLQTLAASLIIGGITPYIQLPKPETDITQSLPPRRVHLLTEITNPTPTAAPLPAAPSTPPTPPTAKTTASQSPPAPVASPRQKAASAGVLAMSAALNELQGSVPRTGSRVGKAVNATGADEGTTPTGALTANIGKRSGGIDGGVEHRSVLGAPGLPAREAGSQGTGVAAGEADQAPTGATPQGGVRSQEQIQELLDQKKGAMYTLYNRELRKDANLQGKLVMSITIAPAGHVTRCVILSSELNSSSLEQQLVALVSRMNFGEKPGAGAVTTKIPIEFFPQ